MILQQSFPHSALQNYIAYYLFASVENTGEFASLTQSLFPLDVPGLCFYFPKKLMVEHAQNHLTTYAYGVYSGLITSPISISFPPNEKIRGLMIYFKPSGFSDLFRLNASEVTDQIPDFFGIRGKEAESFYAQLEDAPTFQEQVEIANNYFLKKLPRRDDTAQIRSGCSLIAQSHGMIDIKKLAYETNMSVSTLERQFTKRVGVSPKTFARFKRFHYSLDLIHSDEPDSFFKIAHECGYFDQAHFIKEFQEFTHLLPSAYHSQQYPIFQQFILPGNGTNTKK